MKVYRCSYPGAGKKAAEWVKKTMRYKSSLSSYIKFEQQKFTYCTKIIYQAYKFGVSEKSVKSYGLHIISPYAIKDNFIDPYKLRLVKAY
ncbi:Uncharacterised protein [Staphylococcus aureus]|uniref:Uncharacterized protein n=1 Tax=Staphylococcus aureus TaxID=1280 RepID=A0A380EFF7_STAAU|nr:Uncharacterised protein [Staphylococcus aureus]